MSKNITLNIEGMDCSSCALGISKQLEKNGMSNVDVNFATGEARFTIDEHGNLKEAVKDIHKIGYKVIDKKEDSAPGFSSLEKKFYFTLFFTTPLFLHMFIDWNVLHHPLVQLALCIPVLIIGILHFGKSAWGSLRSGVPNMDVLIFIGSTSAFIYSLIGTIQFFGTPEVHHYLFYETAATIITLVLLGNVIEYRSVKQTTTAIQELSAMQKVTAKKLEIINGKESIREVEVGLIKAGDFLIVNDGDQIPVDGIVVSGTALVNEAMLTGESLSIEKKSKDHLIGGTILLNGNIKMQAEKVGNDTVLAKIIDLVKGAQQNKPAIQKLGDKVSAIFVPVVIGISTITFCIWYFLLGATFQNSMLNAIAVLVISCPCAMGLATPTAVMAGIGRAAKRGILIKGGQTLEVFAKVKNIVFDKTGTLTTGVFQIKAFKLYDELDEASVKNILFTLEQNSSHPLAHSLVRILEPTCNILPLQNIHEIKGKGIQGEDGDSNTYQLGSAKLSKEENLPFHQVYLFKNGKLVAGLNMEDEIREEAKASIALLKSKNIEPVLLSGDKKETCEQVGNELGIKKIYSEQQPEQKLIRVAELSKSNKTAMVGDGINDAPALAKADVGISLSNATQVAIQSAQIILLNGNLSKLNEALSISKHTLITIKQNLFWAFFYNVVAIPIAAAGYLSPMLGVLIMAFSDLIVIGNSIRLKTKKI